MLYRLGANLVVLVHFAFIIGVVLGGLASLRWRWAKYVHIPMAVWGGWIELSGRICPLTPLENHLRRLGGEAGYGGGFIEHYIIPVMYPSGLTRGTQVALGVFVLIVNLGVYWWVFARERGKGKGEVARAER